MRLARDEGIKVGMLRLITLWPFNDALIEKMCDNTKAVIMAEMNLGQMVGDVRRASKNKVPVHLIDHAGGAIIEPETILAKIREVAK